MTLIYHHPKITDIVDIMKIEEAGFSAAEAATKEAMLERIQLINESFIVACNQEERVVGYIVGPAFHQRYLTDDLFEDIKANQTGDRYQTILSLAIDPAYQRRGIASQLLKRLAEVAQEQQRVALTLTCLEVLVPFYEQNGFQNEGISESAHGGGIWYNMVRTIAEPKE